MTEYQRADAAIEANWIEREAKQNLHGVQPTSAVPRPVGEAPSVALKAVVSLGAARHRFGEVRADRTTEGRSLFFASLDS